MKIKKLNIKLYILFIYFIIFYIWRKEQVISSFVSFFIYQSIYCILFMCRSPPATFVIKNIEKGRTIFFKTF